MKHYFNKEQISDIINKYNNQFLSMSKIGKDYQVSKTCIRRILTENGVEIRQTNHIYYANYRIFKKIDSKEKAYWLGFIAADGCVYQREKNASLIISLNRRDRDHLEKFKVFANTNANILDFVQTDGFSDNTEMSKIVLNSKKMIEDLIDKGITPRKSLTLKPPKIDKQYWLSFIKGYFDGDGSIYKTNQYNNYSISFLGTKEFLQWVKQVLDWEDATLEQRVQNSQKDCYYIRCGGTNKPYQIMKRFYSEIDICLDRKNILYQELQTVVLNRNIK